MNSLRMHACIGGLSTSVTLISNITSESGSFICPGIIQFTCMAQLMNITTLRWFINSDQQQEQISYSVLHSNSTFPITISEVPQIMILSADLSIADREANFLSTLTTDILWFNHMNTRSISCGTHEQYASFATNFHIKGKDNTILHHHS